MTLPDTMQAVIQRGDGYSASTTGPKLADARRWLDLAEIPVPQVGAGQALVRVRRASVNPSDIHFIKGEYGQPREKGRPAGFEGCGDVVAGPEALLGKRVAFVAGRGGSGAWAEYALLDASGCIPLRPEISDTDGAAQIVNPLTAMAMVDIAAEAGDAFVATAAASQLGKLMCGLARDRGLTLIGTVRRPGPVASLKDAGAAEVLDTSAEGFAAEAREMLDRLKPAVMLDAVSDAHSETLFRAMPVGGRWITYGKLSPEPVALTEMGQLIFMSKRIEGFWLSNWFGQTGAEARMKAVTEVQARFADRRWSTDVSEEVPLGEMLDRLPTAAARTDGKVIVTVWDGA